MLMAQKNILLHSLVITFLNRRLLPSSELNIITTQPHGWLLRFFKTWIASLTSSPLKRVGKFFSSHQVAEKFLRTIWIELFKANLTAHVQPVDAGLINDSKAHYQKRFLNQAYCRSKVIDIPTSEIYRRNILTAMCLAKLTWHSVTADTIRSCWKHTVIVFVVMVGLKTLKNQMGFWVHVHRTRQITKPYSTVHAQTQELV